MNSNLSSLQRASAYAAFASFLLNPPEDPALAQAFFDRVAVPCSSSYVPLAEQCIRAASKTGGRWSFGASEGTHARHVAQCYEKAGFDHRRLEGCEPLVRSLKPDTLAAECAFMAFLLSGSARTADGSPWSEADAYADAFLLAHLAAWTDKAALICAEKGDDQVGRLVAECAAFVAEDAESVPRNAS